MDFHYQDGDADRQPERPIIGLQMIARHMGDITFQPGNEHEMRSLTGQQVDALLEPFKSKPVPDNAWRVEHPDALDRSVRAYLEKRHNILDLLGRKEFNQHGQADLTAAEAEIAARLQELITPMELTHAQRMTSQKSGISLAK